MSPVLGHLVRLGPPRVGALRGGSVLRRVRVFWYRWWHNGRVGQAHYQVGQVTNSTHITRGFAATLITSHGWVRVFDLLRMLGW